MSDKPQGFKSLTDAQLLAEGASAKQRDSGYGNTEVGHYTPVGQYYTDFGYIVREETGLFGLLHPNNELQSVSSSLIANGVQTAKLRSVDPEYSNYFQEIEARSDGKIIYRSGTPAHDDVSIIDSNAPVIRYDADITEVDVTKQLAAVGITASSIRRTQKDIASDGEVSRPEQKTIKDLLSVAENAKTRSR